MAGLLVDRLLHLGVRPDMAIRFARPPWAIRAHLVLLIALMLSWIARLEARDAAPRAPGPRTTD